MVFPVINPQCGILDGSLSPVGKDQYKITFHFAHAQSTDETLETASPEWLPPAILAHICNQEKLIHA